MEWMQVLTNLLSVGAPMAGAVYIFYSITSSRIDRMETFHREDINRMDANFIRMEEKFVRIEEKFVRMDEKWERLFERLLID